MKILVAYSSKSRSTKGIAEFIGEKIREKGLKVDVLKVEQVGNSLDYDAFIIGSAVYMHHWMKEARKFVAENKSILSSRPLWLFSSGPLGKEKMDSNGRDQLDPSVSGPNEFEEMVRELHPRDHRIFFGAFDPKNLDFLSRQFFKSSSVREATPIGDFRDWKEIEVWSLGIAHSLEEIPKVERR